MEEIIPLFFDMLLFSHSTREANIFIFQERRRRMNLTPTIISYRSQTDQTAHFLNVDDLLKSGDYEKIITIYNDIYYAVTTYEPDHVDSLSKVEQKLYDHIVVLKENLEKENKGENKGWKAIGLGLLTFGIRPLVLFVKKKEMEKRMEQIDRIHSKFLNSLDQMRCRILEKELHPKPEAIKKLEKRYLPGLEDELFRLKSIPRVAKSLENVNKKKKLSEKHQVALGRSLELREELKDTHYIINHGQNVELMVVNMVARKLKQEFEPQTYESFEPLRHNTALRHIREDTHTVAWYQNQISSGKYNDHGLRRELICGDCVLESATTAESAIDFFAGRTNIAARDNPSLINNLLLTIIQDYIPNTKVAHELCSSLVKLLDNNPHEGNLYSICIPKEKFDESCYFSKPYGIPLRDQQSLRVSLEEMQSGENPCGYPQIRILSHKIRAQDGYHVILNSTFTTNLFLKIDYAVSCSIQAALLGYHLSAEITDLSRIIKVSPLK